MGFSLSHNAELNAFERGTSAADMPMLIQDFDVLISIQDFDVSLSSKTMPCQWRVGQKKAFWI